MNKNSQLLATVAVLAAVTMWGLSGAFLKWLVADGMSNLQATVVKICFGLAFAGLLVLLQRKSVRMPARDIAWSAMAGVIGVLGFSLLYNQTVVEVGMGTATVLIYLMPAMVTAYECLRGRDRFTPMRGLVLVLSLVGCALVAGVFDSGIAASPTGLAAGVGAAALYAVYNIVLAGPLQGYDSSVSLFWLYALAVPVGFVALAATGELVPIIALLGANHTALWLSMGLGFLCAGLSYYLYGVALANLPVSRVTLLATFEPVSAVLFGMVLFAEPMTLTKFLGVVCVLAALMLPSRR